ncbi:MAG: hypothetical protein R3C30_09045 [Hyphomonadaceae bacterium]
MTTTTKTAQRTLTLQRADFHFRRWRNLLTLELYGIEPPVELNELIAPEVVRAIEAGVIEAPVASSAKEVCVDVASFHAWLLRQGVAPPGNPPPVNRLDVTSRHIHPATAAAWITFGDAWQPDRVAAFLNRIHRVHLMLCDHDAGAVVLDPATLALANEILAAEVVFNKARDEVEIEMRTCGVESYAADAGRILHGGDFASAIWLDIVKGRYVVSPIVEMLSDDWYRAKAAADRIGAVRLSGSDLMKKFGRRRAMTLARNRAAPALRDKLETWRRGDGPRPKRSEWEAGVGADLCGTRYAAREVWTQVTRDPAYAEARKPGRPRGSKKNSAD